MSRAPYSGKDELELLEQAANYNRRLVDLVCGVDAPEKRAVDFGAGTGTLALAVAERGYEVTCIEPDSDLRATIAARGVRVLEGLEALDDESASFIYSVNVLEHIENDSATLEQLYRKLHPGGSILLYVPAFPILYSEMDRRVGHVRRYTKSRLTGLVRACGLRVEDAEYADSLGFLVSLVFKWIGSRGLSGWSIRLYDRVVFPLSRALDALGLSRVLGKNLVVVARRTKTPLPGAEPAVD